MALSKEASSLRIALARYIQNIQAQPAHILSQHAGSLQCSQKLHEMLSSEFDETARKQSRAQSKMTIRQFQKRCQKLRSQNEKLKEELKSLSGEKYAGKIEMAWYVRTAFADPALSLQSLSHFCRDFGITEKNTISSTRIGQAKDAMAEVLKSLAAQSISVAAAVQPCMSVDFGKSQAFVIRHVHDEACMALRSYHSAPSLGGRIIRGKYSKVQNNVVEVVIADTPYPVFYDLQALMKKDGRTIAWALCKVVESVLEALTSASTRDWTTLRVIHCLTGDGIATNANGARRLLHHFEHVGSYANVPLEYSLLCVRCASHTANLCVQVGIVGELRRDPVNNCDLTAALSRWFKHILPSHIEEVHVSLHKWLDQARGNGARILNISDDMCTVYGPKVCPQTLVDALRDLLEQENPTKEHKQALFCQISRVCLIAQERPVPTRFFLFSPCVRALLTLKLLHVPSAALQPTAILTGENNRRWNRFVQFYDSASCFQRLKKTALCLTLTDAALQIASQKPKEGHEGRNWPTIVRLAKGEVQEACSAKLLAALTHMVADVDLDLTDAVFGLLVTHGHIVVRFHEYAEFPFALWKLTSQFNADGQVTSIDDFLGLPEHALDYGYSVRLQRQALQTGSLAKAISFLCSADVQSELLCVLGALSASSLDVERKHAIDKKQEKNKVRTIATASRNAILAQYRVCRHRTIDAKIKAVKNLKRKRTMSSMSLAVQRQPHLLPRPAGFMPPAFAHKGNMDSLRNYHMRNKDTLAEEARSIRAQAREHYASISCAGSLPRTNADWMSWLQQNEAMFRELLRSATSTRRSLSERIVPPTDDMPLSEPLRPNVAAPNSTPVALWQKKLLQQKSGWFCIRHEGGKSFFFYIGLRGQGWALELSVVAPGKLELVVPVDVHMKWRPVSQLSLCMQCSIPDDVAVFVLDVRICAIEAGDGNILSVSVLGAEEVVLKPRKKREARTSAFDESGSDVEGTSWDMSEAEAYVSDRESFESSFESGSDVAQSLQGEAEDAKSDVVTDSEDEQLEEKTVGSNVVAECSNAYFTLENYALSSAKEDCKMRIRPRWCCPEPSGMGSKPEKSKTMKIVTIDSNLKNPTRVYILLRCWSLWRARQGSWLQHRPSRQRWWDTEFADIRVAIGNLGFPAGTTGSAAADSKIKIWLPEVLD